MTDNTPPMVTVGPWTCARCGAPGEGTAPHDCAQETLIRDVTTGVSLWENDGDVRGRPDEVWDEIKAEARYVASALWEKGYRPPAASPEDPALAAVKHLAATTGATIDEAARGLATIAKAFPAPTDDEQVTAFALAIKAAEAKIPGTDNRSARRMYAEAWADGYLARGVPTEGA